MRQIPDSIAAFDAQVIAHAAYFTVFAQVAPGDRVREEYDTRAAAEQRGPMMAAELDRGVLVYAVDDEGHQALINSFRPARKAK